jgi:hypothetical protein
MMSDSLRFKARMASLAVLPAAFFRVEVGASLGGVAQLDGGHDVQSLVDLPVPGP